MLIRYTALLLCVSLLIGVTPSAEAADLLIIVNKANPLNTISAEELSKVFLRKTETWPNGSAITPVDLAPNSPVRTVFSKKVHGREVSAIKSYWQRQIFSGKAVPPVEYGSEKAVITAVAGNFGAVGYVSESAEIVDGVKVLVLTD